MWLTSSFTRSLWSCRELNLNQLLHLKIILPSIQGDIVDTRTKVTMKAAATAILHISAAFGLDSAKRSLPFIQDEFTLWIQWDTDVFGTTLWNSVPDRIFLRPCLNYKLHSSQHCHLTWFLVTASQNGRVTSTAENQCQVAHAQCLLGINVMLGEMHGMFDNIGSRHIEFTI